MPLESLGELVCVELGAARLRGVQDGDRQPVSQGLAVQGTGEQGSPERGREGVRPT